MVSVTHKSNTKKLKVIFMGTPEFSVSTLDMLNHHHQVELLGALSMPSRAAGRGKNIKDPEVISYCKAHKISFWQSENINKDDTVWSQIEKLKPDMIVVLAFAQFLGKKVLGLPRLGCFNIHTSLLPKYRGAAPIQYALLNGDSSTGVSIQRMVKKMDAGDLVISHPVQVHGSETGGQLYTRLKFQAALSCSELIQQACQGSLTFTPQNEAEISFAPTLKKDDGFLNFKKSSAQAIYNQVRALKPWPGTFCYLGEDELKFKIIEVSISNEKLTPGEVLAGKKQLTIGTQSGSIEIHQVQLPGKKPVEVSSFLNGYNNDEKGIQINL